MCLATRTNKSATRVCFLNSARLFVAEFPTEKCLVSLFGRSEGREICTRGRRKQDEEAKEQAGHQTGRKDPG
jgi:hypothetical protein